MGISELPHFPYHRDPIASGSIKQSNDACDCCGVVRGILYDGSIYSRHRPKSLCPWCIADGSAETKYGASFFDGHFCDAGGNDVEIEQEFTSAVFGRTIGFATYNPIGWWVHCDVPAEYITRNEPYEMVFECRNCHQRQIILDMD